MSKYLTSGKSTRYTRSDQLNGSAYARATQLNRDKNNSSDATESADEIQQYVSLVGSVDYTEHDLKQFSAMVDFPSHVSSRKRTDHGIWASCQFTDQDNAGIMQLQHELIAVTNSKR